jgi:uncharacterized membrane protein
VNEPTKRQKAIAWQNKKLTPWVLIAALVLVLAAWWARGFVGWAMPLVALFCAFALYKQLSSRNS